MREDILYFIIIAAVIVFNIVRKVRKAQQAEQEDNTSPANYPTPAVPSPWETVMRELQQQSPKEPEVIEKQPKVDYSMEKYESQEKIIDEIESLETETYRKKDKPKQEPILQEENNLSHEYEIHTPDDLKKAIIYTEILNRKYV